MVGLQPVEKNHFSEIGWAIERVTRGPELYGFLSKEYVHLCIKFMLQGNTLSFHGSHMYVSLWV